MVKISCMLIRWLVSLFLIKKKRCNNIASGEGNEKNDITKSLQKRI